MTHSRTAQTQGEAAPWKMGSTRALYRRRFSWPGAHSAVAPHAQLRTASFLWVGGFLVFLITFTAMTHGSSYLKTKVKNY